LQAFLPSSSKTEDEGRNSTEFFGVKQRHGTIRSNDNFATFIKEVVLEFLLGKSAKFRAGG